MKSFVLALVAFVALAVLGGCLRTREDIEAEQSGNRQEKQTLSQQKQQAAPYVEKAPPAGYRFEEIDEQMRAMSGRVDNLENSIAAIHQAKLTENGKEKQGEQKFLAYEEELKKLQAQIAAINEEIAKLKAPPPEPVAPTLKGRALFDQGEENFNGKKWKEAIVNFQKYRDQNPKGKLYSDATYKIGACFHELGMKEEAKAFLEEVTTKFPGTKDAKKAALRLKSIK